MLSKRIISQSQRYKRKKESKIKNAWRDYATDILMYKTSRST